MKKLNILLFCIVLLMVTGCEKEVEHDDITVDLNVHDEGTVDTLPVIKSTVLNRAMHYSVYLPPSYSSSTAKYPVLYLLHGMYGNYKDWVKNDMVTVLNAAIKNKKAKEMVVVMPDGLDAFYCNNYNAGAMKYEDFMINEFIPQIEAKYRINAERSGRAIAGLSMGGYGATFHAFKRPEMFCAAYAMSGALEMGTSAPDLKQFFTGKNTDELNALPAYTMECGSEDFLVITANDNFNQFLSDKGFEHTYIKRTGAHDWQFWTACLPKAIEFVSIYYE